MTWTSEKVREVVGLDPWPVFDANREKTLEDLRDELPPERVEEYVIQSRRTGRTTAMLLRAVAVAGNGQRVGIVGNTTYYTDTLVLYAREYAVKCGINPMMISAYRQKRESEKRGSREPEAVCFEDHYVLDRVISEMDVQAKADDARFRRYEEYPDRLVNKMRGKDQ